jgi:DNA-binding Lrp family transcriptional regulator
MKAYMFINARIGAIGEVVHHLRQVDHVLEANMTFGPYDAVAVVKADNIAHLGQILAEVIQPIPGVSETLTCLAVEDYAGR